MTKPHHCVVLHSDPLAQLHLCVYLHAHTPYRVVGIPRSRTALETVFTKTTVDLILCGGAFRLAGAKALRAELRRRGLPVLLLRHHDRLASLEWLRRRLGRTGAKRAVCSPR
ncbi:MAG: hypothetical protein ABMA26_09315 [Limisphaerales bacterium]